MHVEFIERPVVFVETNDDEFCESERSCRHCNAHSRSVQRKRRCHCPKERRIVSIPSSSNFIVKKRNKNFNLENNKRWLIGLSIDSAVSENKYKEEVEELVLSLVVGKNFLFNKGIFPTERPIFSFFPIVQLTTLVGPATLLETSQSNIGAKFSAIFSLEGGVRIGSPSIIELAVAIGPAVNFSLLASFGDGGMPFAPNLMPLSVSLTAMVNIASTVCITGRFVPAMIPITGYSLLDSNVTIHTGAIFITAGF